MAIAAILLSRALKVPNNPNTPADINSASEPEFLAGLRGIASDADVTEVVIVMVVFMGLLPRVTALGLKEHAAPEGNPEQANVTALAKGGFCGVSDKE